MEHIARELRKAWQLGNAPIFNLIELLEDNKIKVIEIESADTFDGLSAWANEGAIPVIVLNNSTLKSLDRKSLTALRELAHLILNLDGHTEKQREKFCHYFAAAILLPSDTLEMAVGKSRTKLLLPELGVIKKQYGISIQAIAYRTKDLGIITPSYFKQFIFFINQSGFSIEEPFAYEGPEKSRRFSQLLFRALGEELISMSKAASSAKRFVDHDKAERTRSGFIPRKSGLKGDRGGQDRIGKFFLLPSRLTGRVTIIFLFRVILLVAFACSERIPLANVGNTLRPALVLLALPNTTCHAVLSLPAWR